MALQCGTRILQLCKYRRSAHHSREHECIMDDQPSRRVNECDPRGSEGARKRAHPIDAQIECLPDSLIGGRSLESQCLEEFALVMEALVGSSEVTVNEALFIASSSLQHKVELGDYAQATVDKNARIFAGFVRFVGATWGTRTIDTIGRNEVTAWLHAPDANRSPPKDRQIENRRCALNFYFRELRALGIYNDDPLIDLARHKRAGLAGRPITDDEHAAIRNFAASTTRDTRNPALVAAAESTASTGELAVIVAADIDVPNQRIWLPGAGPIAPRWGKMSDWGSEALRVHLTHAQRDEPIFYSGRRSGHKAVAAMSTAVAKIYRQARLASDNSRKPNAIRAWAGRQLFDDGIPIEQVAHRLGVESCDTAFAIISVPIGRCDLPPEHRQVGP
jgi:hypothetical protein